MRPRHVSDERTSVGLKCARAKVDLPQPDGPISTIRESSGIVSFIRFASKKCTFAKVSLPAHLQGRGAENVQYSQSVSPLYAPNFEILPVSTQNGGHGAGMPLRVTFRT